MTFSDSLTCVGVSSYTGEGINDLIKEISDSRLEYLSGYKEYLTVKRVYPAIGKEKAKNR